MIYLCSLRRGRRLAWLLLISLLFQQVAVAAHVCVDAAFGNEVASQPGAPQVPVESCHDVLPSSALGDHHPGHAADALCIEHCAPADVTIADAAAGQVPPSSLPPPVFVWVAVVDGAVSGNPGVRAGAVDPPPILRFCQLLI